MANEIIIKQTNEPQVIKVKVTELERGPAGPAGPAGANGRDGAIQYTAGTGIDITGNVISATGTSSTAWGDITGTLADQTDLNTALGDKADATTVGDLSDLTTTNKTSVVNAINEVDANADAAQTAINNTVRYFTLTDYGSITPTASSAGTIVADKTNMNYALNADGSYGKIYGRVRYTSSANTAVTITLPIANLATPDTAFTISSGAWYVVSISGSYQVMNSLDITVNTNHSASITVPAQPSAAIVTVWLPPCIYYFTDFGDTPEP